MGSSEGHFRSGHKFTVIGLLNLAWTQLMHEIYFMVEILYKPPPRRVDFFLLFLACPEKSRQKTHVFCDFWSKMNITITFLVKIPF